MTRPLRVLIVEDSEDDSLLMLRELRRGGFDPVSSARVSTADQLRAALAAQGWDVVLCDHNMPGFDSGQALRIVKALQVDLPFVIVSGSIGEDVAVRAMQAGAQDYLLKGNLARLVPAVERELRDTIERRERRRAEAALLAQAEELRIGHEIQQRLFPAAPPLLPGFEISGVSYPATATGGDYFDYVPMREGNVGVVIGDVSGHGIGPALLMADVRAFLRTLGLTSMDPGEMLTQANDLLLNDIGPDRFISLLLVRLSPRARVLRYVNAGHPAGYVLDGRGDVKSELPATAPALGLFHLPATPRAVPVPLEPGCLVLLLTDGVTEAVSPSGEEFGLGRALDVVRAHRGEPAAGAVAALCGAVRDFTAGEPPRDDVTAVIVKVKE
jgi:serine phosphatase RsbU (regulator of sigma subunit)